MKAKLLTVLLIFLSLNNVLAQRRSSGTVKWLDLEIKGGYGGSMLLNANVIADQNAELAITPSAYEYGARLGLTIGEYIGVGVEFLKGGFSQDYNIKPSGLDSYTKTQNFKTNDILVTLKYTSLAGFYLEAGPKFSTLKSVEVENSILGSFADATGKDYQEHFADKFTSIVFGFGFAVYNGDRLRVNLGLRASYALGDIVEDENFSVLNDGYYRPMGDLNSTTHPFSLKFMAGVSYTFGFWGNASCGRGKLVFFQ